MSKLKMVHCRVCKGEIDRNTEVEGTDWIMPSKNYFYHKKCYEEWGKKKDDVRAVATEEMWKSALWEYLTKDLKIGIDYKKMQSQWTNAIKKKLTPKGIYFTMKYFYEVKKGDPSKSGGGIGIVFSIYEEGTQYWASREQQDRGICSRIEQQIQKAQEQKTVVIYQKEVPKKKGKFSLGMIEEMEE